MSRFFHDEGKKTFDEDSEKSTARQLSERVTRECRWYTERRSINFTSFFNVMFVGARRFRERWKKIRSLQNGYGFGVGFIPASKNYEYENFA